MLYEMRTFSNSLVEYVGKYKRQESATEHILDIDVEAIDDEES